MLETTRLKLVPLTHEQLLLYKNDPQRLAIHLGVTYLERQHDPSTLLDLAEAIEFWIYSTVEFRSHFEWFTNWEIILTDSNLAIGGIGFAGKPDDEGKTMLGYGLDLRFHGKGYATEATRALLSWGFHHDSLKRVVADTPIQHLASQKVFVKTGFEELNRDARLIHWNLNRK